MSAGRFCTMALQLTPQDLDIIEKIRRGLTSLPNQVQELGRQIPKIGDNVKYLYERAKADPTKVPLTEESLLFGPMEGRSTIREDEEGKLQTVPGKPTRPEQLLSKGEIIGAPEAFLKGEPNRLNQAVARDLEDALMANFIGGSSPAQLYKEAVSLGQRLKGAAGGATAMTALTATLQKLYGEEITPESLAPSAFLGAFVGGVTAKPGAAPTEVGAARQRLTNLGFQMSDFGNPKAMQSRYRQVVKSLHPDVVQGAGGTAEEIAAATQAYKNFANDFELATSIKTPVGLSLPNLQTWLKNAWKQMTTKPSEGEIVPAGEGSPIAQTAQALGDLINNIPGKPPVKGIGVVLSENEITPDVARSILDAQSATTPDEAFSAFRNVIKTAMQNPQEFGKKIGIPDISRKQITKLLSTAKEQLITELGGNKPTEAAQQAESQKAIDKRVATATKTYTEAINWLRNQSKYSLGQPPLATEQKNLLKQQMYKPGSGYGRTGYPLAVREFQNQVENNAIEDLSFQGFPDFSTKTLEALKGKATVSKAEVIGKMNELKVNPVEKEVVQLVLDMYPKDKGLSMLEVANKVRELLPVLKRRALARPDYGPGSSYYYPEVLSGDNYQIILLEGQYPHYLPSTHFKGAVATDPLTQSELASGFPRRNYLSPGSSRFTPQELAEIENLPEFRMKGYNPSVIQPNEFGHLRIDEVIARPQTGKLRVGRLVEVQSDVRQKAMRLWKAYLDPAVKIPRLEKLKEQYTTELDRAKQLAEKMRRRSVLVPKFKNIMQREGLDYLIKDIAGGRGSGDWATVIQAKFLRKERGEDTPTDRQWDYFRTHNAENFDLYDAKDSYISYIDKHYSEDFKDFLNYVYRYQDLDKGAEAYSRVGERVYDDQDNPITPEEYLANSQDKVDLIDKELAEATSPSGVSQALNWFLQAYQNRRHVTRMIRELVKYNAEKGLDATEVPSPEMGMRIEFGGNWRKLSREYYNNEQIRSTQGYIPKDISVGDSFRWTTRKGTYYTQDRPQWEGHRNYVVVQDNGDTVRAVPSSANSYSLSDAQVRLLEMMADDDYKLLNLGKLPKATVTKLMERIKIDPDMRVIDYINSEMSERGKWQSMFYKPDDPTTMYELYRTQPGVFMRYLTDNAQRHLNIVSNLRDIEKRRIQRWDANKIAFHLTDLYHQPIRDGYERYTWIASSDGQRLYKVEPGDYAEVAKGQGREVKEVSEADFQAPQHLDHARKAIWENYQAAWDALKDNFGGEVIDAHDKDGDMTVDVLDHPIGSQSGRDPTYKMLLYKHRGDEVKQPVFTFGSAVVMLPIVAQLIRQQYERLNQRNQDEQQNIGLPTQPPVLQ